MEINIVNSQINNSTSNIFTDTKINPNSNLKDLHTQIYLQQNLFDMDQYIKPDINNLENILNPNSYSSPMPNSTYKEKITEITLKNKLLKINSSMKSFNIILKQNSNLSNVTNYQQIPLSLIENYPSIEGKNFFINFLMEFVIDSV